MQTTNLPFVKIFILLTSKDSSTSVDLGTDAKIESISAQMWQSPVEGLRYREHKVLLTIIISSSSENKSRI